MDYHCKLLIRTLKDNFENVEYQYSDFPECEDDSIEVDNKFSLQVCEDGSYGITFQIDKDHYHIGYVSHAFLVMDEIRRLQKIFPNILN